MIGVAAVVHGRVLVNGSKHAGTATWARVHGEKKPFEADTGQKMSSKLLE